MNFFRNPLCTDKEAMIHKFIKMKPVDFFQYPLGSLHVILRDLIGSASMCTLTYRQLTSRASMVKILPRRGRCESICFVSSPDELLTSVDSRFVSFPRYLNNHASLSNILCSKVCLWKRLHSFSITTSSAQTKQCVLFRWNVVYSKRSHIDQPENKTGLKCQIPFFATSLPIAQRRIFIPWQ